MTDKQCDKQEPKTADSSLTVDVVLDNVSDGMEAIIEVQDKILGKPPTKYTLAPSSVHGKITGKPHDKKITVAKDATGKIHISIHAKCGGVDDVKLVPGLHDDADYDQVFPTFQIIGGCVIKPR